MSISALSVSPSAGSAQSSSVDTSAIARIMKQIQQVQKQLTAEQRSNDKPEVKSKLVQQYQQEILALQMQLALAQQQAAEKRTESTAKKEEANPVEKPEASASKKLAPFDTTETSRYLKITV